MRRFIIGMSSFLLGGSAAAALSLVGHSHSNSAAAHPLATSVAPARIAVAQASVSDAYAKGLIVRPISTVLNVPARMRYGEFRWDEKGVPAGPTWVRVDLQSQIISVFRGGHEIGTAVILYGADGMPTPTGKFPILAKFKDHQSQTYDAAMPYTLRLTRDGVSIHGSNVRWGYATHGCVGVPTAFAAKLFNAVAVGDDVLIVGGESRRA